jgi:glycosyltransferase involved in cell wall biosynthesis
MAVEKSRKRVANGRSGLKRVCVVQPFLSHYSLPVFVELAQRCQIDLLYSAAPPDSGFGQVIPPCAPNIECFPMNAFKPFGDRLGIFHRGLLKYILRRKPDVLFLSADMRNLSFWVAVLWGRLLGVPTYAHGHGPFKKKKIGAAYRSAMRILLRLVTSYICYAPAVRRSFVDFGFDDRKLSVAHNSMVNPFLVRPEEKTGSEMGILFIGRLRPDSHLQRLFEAVRRIRENDGLPLRLHVIGTGREEAHLREQARKHPWVMLHGEVYDAQKIHEISLDCFLGCYPGNAGLSVVHMMSLSLPVVTHDDLHAHGPEPSFLREGISGLLYDHADPEQSLYAAVKSLACERETVKQMQANAFNDYHNLVHPSLAQRLWAIVGGGEYAERYESHDKVSAAADLSSSLHIGGGR